MLRLFFQLLTKLTQIGGEIVPMAVFLGKNTPVVFTVVLSDLISKRHHEQSSEIVAIVVNDQNCVSLEFSIHGVCKWFIYILLKRDGFLFVNQLIK